MSQKKLNIAAPWSLSHYIPLNGFHPLYRPLFEHTPDNIQVNTWDNIKLFKQISSLKDKSALLHKINKERGNKAPTDPINSRFQEYFWYPNKFLTKALPGEIEFQHTAPYASLTRPFIFHCESFAPIFFPFIEEGRSDSKAYLKIKNHYTDLLASDLCIGIFSHIPETINFISNFFNNKKIDAKLRGSRIGLCNSIWDIKTQISLKNPTAPTFLFVNSANQNPNNFFTRGGHIVLRFWKELLKRKPQAKLILRCSKPDNALLTKYNVDINFMQHESNKSILWIENYISQYEQNSLMINADFFLLPSLSLHSVSIMQAMKLGAIPIVTDTIGTSIYVKEDNGIILYGVKENLWQTNPELGISFNSYKRTEKLDSHLLEQMLTKTIALLDNETLYKDILNKMHAYVTANFSGKDYANDFWSNVLDGYTADDTIPSSSLLNECLLQQNDIPRVFESPTQPLRRLYTGHAVVYEMGGMIIQAKGNPSIDLNDWSVLSRYIKENHIDLIFTDSIQNLQGLYLNINKINSVNNHKNNLIKLISNILRPFPKLHKYAKNKRLLTTNLTQYYLNKFFGIYKKEPSLVVENYFNYNLVYYYKYYALPMSAGEFDIKRVNTSQECHASFSLEKLLKKLCKE